MPERRSGPDSSLDEIVAEARSRVQQTQADGAEHEQPHQHDAGESHAAASGAITRRPGYADLSGSWFTAALLSALALMLFFPWPGPPAAWQATFAAYFIAIVLQSVPYILLGALISGLMEQLLPSSWLPRLTGKLGFLGLPAIALLSPLFPTCECGVVSIGRGLLRKGLPLPHTLTYLLAAPIINPTVLFTTYLAFQDWRYPVLRALGGFLVSILVGAIFLRRRPEEIFRPEFLSELPPVQPGAHVTQAPASAPAGLSFKRPQAPQRLAEAFAVGGPGAAGAAASAAAVQPRPRQSLISRVSHLAGHIRGDFLEMTVFFLMGVFIASAMKTFIDPGILTRLGQGPVSGPSVMMSLAFVLSLCAEADAYPAASFSEFRIPAHMAFLVLGPMLDIKLLLMYRTVFRPRFIALFALAIVLGVALYVALLEAWL